MECIICKDNNEESLQENTSCSCKYKCHSSCWIDYVHSKTKITCPLCRIDLTVKLIPTIYSPLIQVLTPTAPPYTYPERIQSQQISYQEFVDIIQYNSTQIEETPAIQPFETPRNLTSSKKFIKVVSGLVILLIIILFIVLIKKV